jgi:cellulose biosynthesis protein BcsQ
MKLISFVSLKGGAGKTTALMAIASILIAQGHRIALIEADENLPLTRWKANAEAINTWSDRCLLATCETLGAAQDAIDMAETAGCAFALADTAGGGSDMNMLLIANAHLVIIPTALSVLDLDEAISTLELIDESLARTMGREIPTRLLFTRFPQSRLKSTEQANYDAMNPLPRFEHHLTERAAFADLKLTGPLLGYHEILAASPAKRLLANHMMAAVGEARDVTNELLELV